MIRKTLHVSWPIVLIFTMVWVLFMGVLIFGSPFRGTDGEYETVTNEQYNFSVTYPSKWRAHAYGEWGFRGQHEVRLRIFLTQFGSFEISISSKAAHQPAVEDVAAWGFDRLQQANSGSQASESLGFLAHPLTEDEIAGERVLKRRYSNQQWELEEVYIARAEDMIIITLYSGGSVTDSLQSEFNKIVASFRPVD